MGWPNEWSSVCLPFWELGKLKPRGFESWLSQTNDFKIDTCHFLARRSALLGEVKDWFAQCQDHATGDMTLDVARM